MELVFKKVNYIIMLLLMGSIILLSLLISNQIFSNHFIVAETHSHEKMNHHDQEEDLEHSHTHRHIDGEEEHTHRHINIIAFTDIILVKSLSMVILSLEIKQASPRGYHHLLSTPFTLKILRPPIYS